MRVVVGYRVPAASWRNGRAEVTAGDIAAWVELDAGELGWIPVDVTPDRSRTPDPDTQGSTTEQIAIPNPPPPPPPPPQIEPPRQEEEAIDSEEEVQPVEHEFGTGTGLAPWAVIAVGVAGVPLGLLALFALLVVGVEAGATAASAQPTVHDGARHRCVGRGRRSLHRVRRPAAHRDDATGDGRRVRR